MTLERDSRSGDRFLEVRLALFVIGAIVWLVGLILDQRLVTGAAIVIVLGAAVLGIVARQR